MIQRNWFLGIDWGRDRHQACVMNVAGEVLGNQGFVHSGEGLAELVQWCLKFTDTAVAEVAVAIERPHGAVVETLLAAGFVVHSINPKQLSRFRDRHSPSGAKDDRRDAMVLADALRTDAQVFRLLQPSDEHSVHLRSLLRSYEQLVGERVRLSNQWVELLCCYYPEFLKVNKVLTRRWVLALWKKLPTPKHAQRVRVTTIDKLLRKHGAWKQSGDSILAILRQPPLNVSDACVKACVKEIQLLVERLELVQRQLTKVTEGLDQRLEQMSKSSVCGEHSEAEHKPPASETRPSDAAIVQSLPGAGRITTATFLAKAGDAIKDRNYQALRCLSGVAPVTQQSGKMHRVQRRRAVDKSISKAAYHMARVAIQHDSVSRRKYLSLRKRGHSHGRALRGVADRLLAVVCAMLRDGTLFEHRAPAAALPSAA